MTKVAFMNDIVKINIEFRRLKPPASELRVSTINLLLFNKIIQ